MKPFVLVLALSAALVPPAGRGAGEPVAYTFESEPFGAAGVGSLEELRGRPVFLEYWSKGAWGAHDSVRDALDWQREYGEDLAVVLVEFQGTTEDQVHAFALRSKWFGTRAMWAVGGVPVRTGLRGIPQYVLIGNDGSVLLQGEAGMTGMAIENRKMDEVEEAIREQVRLRREGPDDAPRDVQAAYAAFAKGDVAGALERARAAADAGVALADDALAELRARVAFRLERAEALVGEGRVGAAEEELASLEDELDGESEAKARLDALVAKLAGDALAREHEADAELAKLERKLFEKGLGSSIEKSLARLADKYEGTQSAARARRWIELATAPTD